MSLIPLLFILLVTSGCSTVNRALNESSSNEEEIFTYRVEELSEETQGNERNIEMTTKISLIIQNESFEITLYDNESTDALKDLLPLTITMNELHGNEKYYSLSQSLPTQSERVGNIHTGDLMLYGSDTLVLFYDDFSTSYSYTPLGRVDDISGLVDVLGRGNIEVQFEVVEE